jgi:hypothetical protein
VHDVEVDGRIRIHLVDLAPVLGLADPQALLDEDVRTTYRATIERYLASRIAFERGGFARAKWGRDGRGRCQRSDRAGLQHPRPPAGALTLDTNLFPADPNHQTFVNVYEGALRQQFILSAATEPVTYYRGTTAGALAVMGTFIPSGVHHILIGPDHILFLVGLLLLGGTLRKLSRS